jgi:hypothetical protein
MCYQFLIPFAKKNSFQNFPRPQVTCPNPIARSEISPTRLNETRVKVNFSSGRALFNMQCAQCRLGEDKSSVCSRYFERWAPNQNCQWRCTSSVIGFIWGVNWACSVVRPGRVYVKWLRYDVLFYLTLGNCIAILTRLNASDVLHLLPERGNEMHLLPEIGNKLLETVRPRYQGPWMPRFLNRFSLFWLTSVH